jgi:outer membrane lipoprotein carrier protein
MLVCALAPAAGIDVLLSAVEDRYNHVKTLQASFEQRYLVQGRGKRVEKGELSLQKPGRMLWQYGQPESKFFLSDGKQLYFYSPQANRVEKCPVKESNDFRAPLAFLLGRLDFKKLFKDFSFQETPEGTLIKAAAKSDRSPYTQVEFVIGSKNEIRRMTVAGMDGSLMEFVFSNERLNPSLAEAMFRFVAPAGAEVVEVSEMGEREQ